MKRINSFTKIYQQCNYGSNLEKWRKAPASKSPLYIDVELTNHCNINCYMCPVGTHAMQRSVGFMSMDIVEKICDELTGGYTRRAANSVG